MKYPPHLLQSPEWAEFRQKWGTKVVKAGKAQFTVHPIPHTSLNIGYMARAYPEDIDWELLKKKAAQEKCVYIKFEPNAELFTPPHGYLVLKGERIFSYATYFIDLKKTEDELLAAMHPKTRYNIRLAAKKGVIVKVGHTEKMMNEFLDLYHETNKRQGVFSHPDKYYKTIFEVFKESGKAEIITGYYENKPMASMMLLTRGDTLFYPYGGSTQIHKEVMAFNLVMWEAIRYGKKIGCTIFDMWNCLPPEIENPKHPWYGFHKFKKGYSGELIRFPGAYDIIFIPRAYPLVIALSKIRWAVLKGGAALKKLIKR